MTAGLSNKKVAELLLNGLPDDEFQGVVFFDSSSKEAVILDRLHRLLPLSKSPVKASGAFAFFDEARARGTDLKLRPDAGAVVTVGPKVCKDKLMQAAGRMRMLGKGQRLEFLGTAEVTMKIAECLSLLGDGQAHPQSGQFTSRELLQWVMHNTVRSTEDALAEWASQGTIFATTRRRPDLARFDEELDLASFYANAVQMQKVDEVISRNIQSHMRRATAAGAEPIDEQGRNILDGIRDQGGRYGKDVELVVSAFDEEYERELEKEVEIEEEVERQVAKVKPRCEQVWDFSAVLRVRSLGNLGKIVKVIDLDRITSKTQALQGHWASWPANVKCTGNFAFAVAGARNLDDFLRPVGGIVLLPGLRNAAGARCDEWLLVSQFEGEFILRQFWSLGGASSTGAQFVTYSSLKAHHHNNRDKSPKLLLPLQWSRFGEYGDCEYSDSEFWSSSADYADDNGDIDDEPVPKAKTKARAKPAADSEEEEEEEEGRGEVDWDEEGDWEDDQEEEDEWEEEADEEDEEEEYQEDEEEWDDEDEEEWEEEADEEDEEEEYQEDEEEWDDEDEEEWVEEYNGEWDEEDEEEEDHEDEEEDDEREWDDEWEEEWEEEEKDDADDNGDSDDEPEPKAGAKSKSAPEATSKATAKPAVKSEEEYEEEEERWDEWEEGDEEEDEEEEEEEEGEEEWEEEADDNSDGDDEPVPKAKAKAKAVAKPAEDDGDSDDELAPKAEAKAKAKAQAKVKAKAKAKAKAVATPVDGDDGFWRFGRQDLFATIQIFMGETRYKSAEAQELLQRALTGGSSQASLVGLSAKAAKTIVLLRGAGDLFDRSELAKAILCVEGDPNEAQRAAPGGGGAKDEAWSVSHDFDGASYGPEYLALSVGDKVSRQMEEAGWAFGTVLERARPGAAAGPRRGWYPAEFTKRASS